MTLAHDPGCVDEPQHVATGLCDKGRETKERGEDVFLICPALLDHVAIAVQDTFLAIGKTRRIHKRRDARCNDVGEACKGTKEEKAFVQRKISEAHLRNGFVVFDPKEAQDTLIPELWTFIKDSGCVLSKGSVTENGDVEAHL